MTIKKFNDILEFEKKIPDLMFFSTVIIGLICLGFLLTQI